MKIGIDARLWSETGVGRYIRNLVKELMLLDQSNEYVLFVLKQDLEQIRNQAPGIKNKKWKLVPSDIRWHSLKEQFHFVKILNLENLDLMHFPYFSVPVLYKKPFVITLHDLIIHHFLTGKASTLPFFFYLTKRFFYQRVLTRGIKKAEKIIVPLKTVRQDIMQTFSVKPERIIITPEGFDSALSNVINKDVLRDTAKYQNYFLYVGNAYPHKNLELLIQGFNLFRQKNKQVHLLLVGKKDYFYERLAQELLLGKNRNIHLLHDTSDKELGQLYKNALALVSASKMEGFGLPPLEAMALGCPVLVSDIPAFKEVCQDAAFFFNPSDPKDIASQMQRVFVLQDNPGMVKKIKQGQELAKQFSWHKMASLTLEVYESCVRI